MECCTILNKCVDRGSCDCKIDANCSNDKVCCDGVCKVPDQCNSCNDGSEDAAVDYCKKYGANWTCCEGMCKNVLGMLAINSVSLLFSR